LLEYKKFLLLVLLLILHKHISPQLELLFQEVLALYKY